LNLWHPTSLATAPEMEIIKLAPKSGKVIKNSRVRLVERFRTDKIVFVFIAFCNAVDAIEIFI
jgi:hypothetical protein